MFRSARVPPLHRTCSCDSHPDVDILSFRKRRCSHQGRSPIAIRSHHILGGSNWSLARNLWQRSGHSSLFVEAVIQRRLDIQLWILFIMVVNVFSKVLVFLHDTSSGVTKDGAHHSGETAYLDSRQHTNGTAYAHSHQRSYHWQPSHRDGGIILVAVLILKEEYKFHKSEYARRIRSWLSTCCSRNKINVIGDAFLKSLSADLKV